MQFRLRTLVLLTAGAAPVIWVISLLPAHALELLLPLAMLAIAGVCCLFAASCEGYPRLMVAGVSLGLAAYAFAQPLALSMPRIMAGPPETLFSGLLSYIASVAPWLIAGVAAGALAQFIRKRPPVRQPPAESPAGNGKD